jgi:hypothetical protein
LNVWALSESSASADIWWQIGKRNYIKQLKIGYRGASSGWLGIRRDDGPISYVNKYCTNKFSWQHLSFIKNKSMFDLFEHTCPT